jgi:hypothetical protein
VTINFASLRSRSSGILNVLTTYASGALLLGPWAARFPPRHMVYLTKKVKNEIVECWNTEIPNPPSLEYSVAPRFL